MIELTGVSKQFDGKRRVTALSDVNLAIVRGELVSIVGPSGSGKSTLLNLIGGLDRPTTGDIVIDGQRLGGLSDDQLMLIGRGSSTRRTNSPAGSASERLSPGPCRSTRRSCWPTNCVWESEGSESEGPDPLPDGVPYRALR